MTPRTCPWLTSSKKTELRVVLLVLRDPREEVSVLNLPEAAEVEAIATAKEDAQDSDQMSSKTKRALEMFSKPRELTI